MAVSSLQDDACAVATLLRLSAEVDADMDRDTANKIRLVASMLDNASTTQDAHSHDAKRQLHTYVDNSLHIVRRLGGEDAFQRLLTRSLPFVDRALVERLQN